MSTTLHLECDLCKESIWIGQRDFIYNGEFDLLEEFLFRHVDHPLFFRRSNQSRFMDGATGWTEVVG